MDPAQLRTTIRAMERIYHGAPTGKRELRRLATETCHETQSPKGALTFVSLGVFVPLWQMILSDYFSFLRNSVFSSRTVKSAGASNSERAGSPRLMFVRRYTSSPVRGSLRLLITTI